VCGEQVKLRGARKIAKGNRISCLIENLHSDKKQESDDEEEELERDTEEELKLGRKRMTEIQNIFEVGQGSTSRNKDEMSCQTERSISSNNFKEFQELSDEGLVSTARDRFSTGNILGSRGVTRRSSDTNYIDRKHIDSLTTRFEESVSGKSSKAEVISASSVPRKLKNLDDVFHQKDDYTDCVKMEVKVNKLNPDERFKTHKEEPEKSKIAPKVGKLKLEASVFENKTSEETPTKSPEIRVGRIDVENIFKARTPDKEEEKRDSPKVGKLDKNVYSPSSDESRELSGDLRVGKLNTEQIFRPAEEASRELLSICKPGKLSEEKLRISSNIDESCGERKDLDTDVVPPGKVSQRSLRRSESNLTADMQKKYQNQVARNETLRREKSDVVVVVTSTGKISEARNSFFQSMMTNNSSASSSARLGTSILPTGADNKAESSVSPVVHTTSSKKGKDLFKRMAEKRQEEDTSSVEMSSSTFSSQESSTTISSSLLPGVDFEEIEDEFEKLHREMMRDADTL